MQQLRLFFALALLYMFRVELSPETCRVKPLRRINAIVASCWTYFTINEIYLLIKYIKSVLWRVAKRLSYMEDARCLKVNYT